MFIVFQKGGKSSNDLELIFEFIGGPTLEESFYAIRTTIETKTFSTTKEKNDLLTLLS